MQSVYIQEDEII